MPRTAWLAVSLLPYTLNLAGVGPFYAKAGVAACLSAARDELSRQKRVVQSACAREGGRLTEGPVTETLVQGVQCSAVQPLTCDLPGRASRAPDAGPDPRS